MGFTGVACANEVLSAVRVFSGVSSHHSFIIAEDDSTFGIGRNDDGQLGLGNQVDTRIPTRVAFFDKFEAILIQIACGKGHTLFLTDKGEVFTCGLNNAGQLGLTGCKTQLLPSRVEFSAFGEVLKVCCGWEFSFCLTSEGILMGWGDNSYGQLGAANKANTSSVPCVVEFPSEVEVVNISCGFHQASAMTSDGIIYTWGSYSYGQLGRRGNNKIPGKVAFGSTFERVLNFWCGGYHSALVAEHGNIYNFGENNSGQLGNMSRVSHTMPAKMSTFNGRTVRKMSLGGHHTIELHFTGDFTVYGCNEYGQLGFPDHIDLLSPVKLPFTRISGSQIVDIVSGRLHCILVTEDGCCYGMGYEGAVGEKSAGKCFVKLLEKVDLGSAMQCKADMLTYIKEEQEDGTNKQRTTDMHFIVDTGSSKRTIHLNRAFLAARLGNIFRIEDIEFPEYSIDVRDTILEFLYGDSSKITLENEEFKKLRLLGEDMFSLSQCMTHLHKTKEQEGDLIIVSQNGFASKAHKFVLVARTQYFSALFRGDWNESEGNRVDLEMSLGNSFERYLKWVYTGEIDELDKEAAIECIEYLDYFGGRGAKSLQLYCERQIRISNGVKRGK